MVAPAAAATATGMETGTATATAMATGTGMATATFARTRRCLSAARTVEVTRRLYRSGESEYPIDGQLCRLRDVHEFLMDTGLGAKAYAIIEQGKIGMILSSRPADRRQLIEEAAGVTKYKARRRAAELKLEAAQQNLTRLDDIVFELERQSGSLKRQAGRARRYRRLLEQVRQWEKVLFGGRYRELAAAIESIRARLSDGRVRESAAAARVTVAETDVARFRIDLVEAEARATTARESVHACELDITRREQQREFDRQQIDNLDRRLVEIRSELEVLELRREPGRRALDERRQAAARAHEERRQAAGELQRLESNHAAARQEVEGLEGDVEAARAEVFAALSAATALRHVVENAEEARDRVAEALARLDIEAAELDAERGRVEAGRAAAADGLDRARQAADAAATARLAREAELAEARGERDRRVSSLRALEDELTAWAARLSSLEDLERTRAGYSDAARMVLAQANGRIGQMGAVADYLEVPPQYERAVEACLGDLLQHVIVRTQAQAVAGIDLIREENAGRCGFVVLDEVAPAGTAGPEPGGAPLVALREVLHARGPHGAAVEAAVGDAWIAERFEDAAAAARGVAAPIATLSGDVLRGPHLVSGGSRDEGRGILAVKREIRELGERIAEARAARERCAAEVASLEAIMARAGEAVAALADEHHREDKAIVGFELQLQRAREDAGRLQETAQVLETERRRGDEERRSLDARQLEARDSIARLEGEQRTVDERLSHAQRRLCEAREAIESLGVRVADARASYAALVERATALDADLARLDEASRELDARVEACRTSAGDVERGREARRAAVAEAERLLDADLGRLDALHAGVRSAEDAVGDLRQNVDAGEAAILEARRTLDGVHAELGDLEVSRATAESDLAHLAATCVERLQTTLDEVVAELDRTVDAGGAAHDAAAAAGAEPEEPADEETGEAVQPDAAPAAPPSTPEERIAELRARIDRMGPVNMMAIEQFDELSTRHAFLTTQVAQNRLLARKVDFWCPLAV